MKIYSEILGNVNLDPRWRNRLEGLDVDYVVLDQWTAQKSRFLGKGVSGEEYPVALKRHTQVKDGDVIACDPETGKAVVLKIELSPVLVINLEGIANRDRDTVIRIALELGHAIGNQHWPAIVKGTRIYVPLTVDKKVMMSVLETHHIEGITFDFHPGTEVIPYLAPNEIRELFGGAGHESHSHEHAHAHIVHAHDHDHDGCCHHHHHDDEDGGCHHHDEDCGCGCESESIH